LIFSFLRLRGILLSAPKWILLGTVALFSSIGIAALVKKKGISKPLAEPVAEKVVTQTPVLSVPVAEKASCSKEVKDFPSIDRIFQLFTVGSSKLPIVETIRYSSQVSWLKGRPAWVADYATYYNTSRHFIARSLNNGPDYFSQKVVEGSQFNVLRRDKNIQFHLLVDVLRCKMGFYYVDLGTNERLLLKTYKVGLGRLDPSQPSGTSTPLGRFSLGSKVAIYKPGMMGFHQDQKVEMVRVFGTRWIPLEGSIKGYGLHGAPWHEHASGQPVEDREVIGAYDGHGCIRLSSEDMEELFSIVLTKPTFLEVVKDFHEAKLPGVEVATPSR
jgi:L,D-transpeptidase catalytic domain